MKGIQRRLLMFVLVGGSLTSVVNVSAYYNDELEREWRQTMREPELRKQKLRSCLKEELYTAIKFGNATAICPLLDSLRQEGVICDEMAPKPLLLAAAAGNEEAVNMLIQCGCSVFIDGTGAPLLTAAIQEFGLSTHLLRLLKEKGIDFNQVLYAKMTPLEWALNRSGSNLQYLNDYINDKMEVLIELGCDPSPYPGVLLHAVHCGRVKLAKAVLDAGTKIENSGVIVNGEHQPLLIAAVLSDSIAMVRFLLSRGFDKNVKDRRGYTALYYASLPNSNHDDMVRLLRRHGMLPYKIIGGAILIAVVVLVGRKKQHRKQPTGRFFFDA